MSVPLIYILLGIAVMFIYYLIDDTLEQTFAFLTLMVLLWPIVILSDVYMYIDNKIKEWTGKWK